MAAPIVVVGAGQAAASLAARHVARASSQPLLLIGDESHPPCQRPPLSKKYLLGQLERERLFIRPRDWYAGSGVETRFDRTVRRAPDARCVSIWYYADDRLLAIDAMNDPKAYAFGRMIIEAGKHPPPERIADPATDLRAIAKS